MGHDYVVFFLESLPYLLKAKNHFQFSLGFVDPINQKYAYNVYSSSRGWIHEELMRYFKS
jgi:hypothetical protein